MANIFDMSRRLGTRMGVGIIAACLGATSWGLPSAGATPALAGGIGNVSRFAQVEWTTKHGAVRTRWMLTARDTVLAYAWREPGATRHTYLTLSWLECRRGKRGCNGRGRSWVLDDNSFYFDPLMNEVGVLLPGKAELVWTATENPHVATGRSGKPRVYDDPADYVGADADVTAIGAIGRNARVTGHVDGYEGRIKTSSAVIYSWVGASAFAGACVLDQGGPCL